MEIGEFNQELSDAVNAAQVGFHFEEGGCWGMANAMYAKFMLLGYDPVIKYKPTGFVHCWVEVDGLAFDYRGSMDERPVFGLTIQEEWLQGIAEHFGVSAEEYYGDTAAADEILSVVIPFEVFPFVEVARNLQ